MKNIFLHVPESSYVFIEYVCDKSKKRGQRKCLEPRRRESSFKFKKKNIER